MKYELYKEVALAIDIPDHNLKQGDIATIVEYLPQGTNKEPGLALEVFNVLGESIDVIMIAESQVEPLKANEISHVRTLKEAA